MAGICRGMMSDSDGCEGSSRGARLRRKEIRRFRFVAETTDSKRQKLLHSSTTSLSKPSGLSASSSTSLSSPEFHVPKFGVASVCGRRRDMEDAVSIHPSFLRRDLHYYGVFDGHGCSRVAVRCKERLHELMKQELVTKSEPNSWKETMERSFEKMDTEALAGNDGVCCESQTPACKNAGSTAVVAIVTPRKIIVANCGDSRAVLCRNGKPVPLSTDHKIGRTSGIESRKQGVESYVWILHECWEFWLKPYVSSVPEVTITDRTAADECLILASDGLWDVVSNDIACGVARMCLREKAPESETETANKACSDASMLLTKLALARHSSDNVSVVVVALGHNDEFGME